MKKAWKGNFLIFFFVVFNSKMGVEIIKRKTRLATLSLVTIISGVISGSVGILLIFLLRTVQHIAYGYGYLYTFGPENFLEGVSAASPSRRVFVLTLCGLFAGFGWWVIYRFGKPLVSISDAMAQNKRIPMITIAHALLQIITVALGSPLGRETAPREIAATCICWLAKKTGLSEAESKIMIACSAGAGLAAVYNVPLGGALFSVEVLLLGDFRFATIIPAIIISAIATAISWIGLGDGYQYQVSSFSVTYSLIFWSILVGPIIGVFAHWFNRIAILSRQKAPRQWQIIPLCMINFFVIGLLAIHFPVLLGNGKSPIELGISNLLDIKLAISLFLLRILIVWTSLRAGAEGGLITPSLANGVTLAIILGHAWSMFFPGLSFAAFSVIGAAAFLAASQRMPMTAIVLTAEFTSINFNCLVPIMFAIGTAVLTSNWLHKRYLSHHVEH